jgi:hypothetical protein
MIHPTLAIQAALDRQDELLRHTARAGLYRQARQAARSQHLGHRFLTAGRVLLCRSASHAPAC